MPGLVRAPAGKAVLGVRLKAAVNSAHVKWADYCSKSVKCESTCLHFQPWRCALASASCDLSVPVTRMLFPSRRRVRAAYRDRLVSAGLFFRVGPTIAMWRKPYR